MFKRRVMTWILVLAMVISLMPAAALAEDPDERPVDSIVTEAAGETGSDGMSEEITEVPGAREEDGQLPAEEEGGEEADLSESQEPGEDPASEEDPPAEPAEGEGISEEEPAEDDGVLKEDPAAEEPAAEEPAAEAPAAEEPAAEEPAAEAPGAEEPAAEEPVAEDPKDPAETAAPPKDDPAEPAAAEEPAEETEETAVVPAEKEPEAAAAAEVTEKETAVKEEPAKAGEEKENKDAAADKGSLKTEEEEKEVRAADAVVTTPLTISSFDTDWDVVSASLEGASGTRTLVLELNGAAFRNLYKGTYEAAVANGTATGNWIKGTKNSSSNYVFRVSVTEAEMGEFFLTAISQTYYTGYQNGSNILEKMFYPQAISVSLSDSGNYLYVSSGGSYEITVIDNANLFTPGWPWIGFNHGPNAPDYSCNVGFEAGEDFTKAYLGTAAQARNASESDCISMSWGSCTIPLKWTTTPGDPSTLQSRSGKKFAFSMFSQQKNDWIECNLTVDDVARTITIDPAGAGKTRITSLTLSAASMTYTGQALKPGVTVKAGKKTLKAGTDYTVAYKQNVKPGKATVTVTGKNNYEGTLSEQFMVCFVDVPMTHNYAKAVYWAVEKGIAAGYTDGSGKFGINDNVTRAQFVMFLWKSKGKPNPKGTKQTFKDVPTTSNFYKAIQWASENKIAAGYSGDKKGYFGPNDPVTRGQLMLFLWRYAGKPTPSNTTTQTFTDIPVGSGFYLAAQWASENKIAAGYSDGSFGKTLNCKRGQCMKFIYQLLKNA